jgi:hypothetical protein
MQEKSKVQLTSSIPLQVCDLNSTETFSPSTVIEDSSDLMHPVPEDSIAEELLLKLSDVSADEIARWLGVDSTAVQSVRITE